MMRTRILTVILIITATNTAVRSSHSGNQKLNCNLTLCNKRKLNNFLPDLRQQINFRFLTVKIEKILWQILYHSLFSKCNNKRHNILTTIKKYNFKLNFNNLSRQLSIFLHRPLPLEWTINKIKIWIHVALWAVFIKMTTNKVTQLSDLSKISIIIRSRRRCRLHLFNILKTFNFLSTAKVSFKLRN